jgi:hypothetical protein
MKRFCNHEFFDNVDSEYKAYWLGFIAADGCLTSGRNTLQVKLAPKDRSHLEKMKLDFVASHVIYDCDKYCQLRLDSKKIATALRSRGISSCKTFNLSWDEIIYNLSDDMVSHFIRGYFDGDGCWGSKGPKYPKSVVFTITCAAPDFTNGLHQYLERCGFHVGKYVSKSGIYRLQTCSRSKCIDLYKYLYSKANVYLNRKRIKAIDLIGEDVA